MSSDAFKRLDDWRNKRRSVDIRHDNSLGSNPGWEVVLSECGSVGRSVYAVGAWWDPENGEPPATCNDGRPLVYAGDSTEEEWASLEQVVTAALDAWEEGGDE